MAKSMTLEQVKEAKKNLELELVKMFKSFESETQLRIRYTNIKRKRPKRNKSKEGVYIDDYEMRERQPIIDVQLDVDLDLLM
jgi:hypothetical protein